MPRVLGVDLGATNLRVALGDADGAILARADEPVPASGEELAARVAALGRALAGDAWDQVRGGGRRRAGDPGGRRLRAA